MELAIIKRETIGDNAQSESETVAKFEIMDGAPVKGESIPIRLFLSAYDLTPTMRDVQKKFSSKYYLNLVLVDEEERRYFKQQEIILWRKADKYKTKQERADQMQVYESAQERNQATMEKQLSSRVNNKSANRVRHDENGDLLNNGNYEEIENDNNDDKNWRSPLKDESD
jgi:vacuolar protein sorting-associated protein 26